MSKAKIFLAGDKAGQWKTMEETPYDQEVVLQLALAEYPDLLPGDQIDPDNPRQWLLVRRELSVPAQEDGGSVGSLDHLYLDQDGIPTFVECKRAADTRSRREVVAQMLDYAANGTEYWPMEKLRQAAAETAINQGYKLDERIVELTGEVDSDVESYWNQVEENLRQGRIRLIFVADSVPRELRRLVEFLNSKMSDVEVLAVEVKQFLGHGQKAMVSRVIGLTETTRGHKDREKKQWDEPSFFDNLAKNAGESEIAVARKILNWSKEKASYVSWGKGKRTGSFVPVLSHKNEGYSLFALYSNGNLGIYFQWYRNWEPFDSPKKRLELLEKLNTIENVSMSEDEITRRPSIRLSVLAESDSTDALLQIFDWLIDEFRKT